MGVVRPNRHRYLLSLADELHAQATRVRDLIGDAHFLSDGHHKEYLLIDVLQRHLPAGMVAARGFVISPANSVAVSREQDILVVDTMRESPVFNQGGVIIGFPNAVRAAVSVKTKMENETVRDSVAGLNTVRSLAAGHLDPRGIWCGAYYFDIDPALEGNPSLVFGQIARAVAAYPVFRSSSPSPHPVPLGPDLHCSAHELAFKLDHGYASDQVTTIPAKLRGYRCRGLATAIFLGELLDHLATGRGSGGTDFTHLADDEGGGTELIGEKELA